MPLNYNEYPPNWLTDVRPRILKQHDNKCAHCGAENYAIGYRDKEGIFHEVDPLDFDQDVRQYIKFIKISLTIAHLDHDHENWNVEDDRLAPLCQKCHNYHDRIQRAESRYKTRLKKKNNINKRRK